LRGEKKMKKIILTFVVAGLLVALNFMNIITMTDVNTGMDLFGNSYFMEGYGKGDKVLILENSYYEVVKEFKLN
jgi:hypothetical protein